MRALTRESESVLCVATAASNSVILLRRASRVDVKKLEKQEAKLKVSINCFLCQMDMSNGCFQAKIEKRARRDLYEGSKLLDQHRKQVS